MTDCRNPIRRAVHRSALAADAKARRIEPTLRNLPTADGEAIIPDPDAATGYRLVWANHPTALARFWGDYERRAEAYTQAVHDMVWSVSPPGLPHSRTTGHAP